MERRAILYVGFVVCLLALTTLQASSTAPTGTISVGDFAVLVASRMTVSSGGTAEGLTPAIAADLLEKHGVKLGSDLTGPLSEKQAVDLFGQLGISLQTADPEALLSPERAASLVGIFGRNLASTGSRLDMSLDAKASGSTGVTVAPESVEEPWWPFPDGPEDCNVLWPTFECTSQVCRNPCQYCCLKQLGLNGTLCGHLCQKKNLIVTPEEPTP